MRLPHYALQTKINHALRQSRPRVNKCSHDDFALIHPAQLNLASKACDRHPLEEPAVGLGGQA